MKSKYFQIQTRRFLRPVAKVLCLFVSLLILGSFATSHAQNRDVSVFVRFDKECGPNASTVLQMWIGATKWAEGFSDISVPPGPHDLRAIVKKELRPDLFITRIWYRDVVLPDQISTFNAPEANFSITVSPPPPPGSEAAQRVARLEIDLTCGVPPAGGKLPIIFLPGVAGTELLNNSAVARAAGTNRYAKEVWPLAKDALNGITRYSLLLHEDGETPADKNTKMGDIIVRDILRRSSTLMEMDPWRAKMNFYGGMMEFIETKGYKEKPQQPREKRDLFAFPYDWRKDNAKQLPALDAVINTALSENNAKKVILLAHSMGGVIARAYILSKPEWAAKVDSLITMGTPYWGATKPYYAVVSGYDFDNDSVDREVMKILAQNFPSAYQLMPSYPFIEDGTNKRMLTSAESNSIRYKGVSDVTPPKQIVSSYKETPGNDWSFNNDPGFVKLIQDFNDPQKIGTEDIPKPLPAGVKHYVIIGVGVKTLERYLMRDLRPTDKSYLALAGRRVVLEPIFGDGDGTVPCEGSEISTATSTYYIPYVAHFMFDDSSGHSDLPANKTVQEIVGEIIDGKPPKPSKYKVPCKRTLRFTRDTAPGLKDLDKGVDFTLHSDAHLSIADQGTGRKLGFNNQGGIDEDLPSGTFLAMEGAEYASIADIDRTLKVTVTGFQEGRFTLDVDVKRAGSTVAQFSYREVPVQQGTVAEVTMTPGQVSSPPPLTVTTDGMTTTIPASSSAGGPVIPQGGTPQSTPVSPLPPSSGGIGGTWTAPTGDIIELIQNGNRITGRYRGILGTGEITGTFDGKNLSATVRPNQALLPLAIPLTLTLMEDGKLFGRLETPLTSGALVFSRTGR